MPFSFNFFKKYLDFIKKMLYYSISMKIDSRYMVLKNISETQNNIVYKVIDTLTDDVLALKLLRNNGEDYVSQFKKEYFILQTFTHPNIIKVYNFSSFEKEGKAQFYFTMEYVDGVPFYQYFLKNNYSNFLPLFLETLNIFSFIHKKGYLHCDLKPTHILIDKNGRIKLVDFGFAQFQKNIIREEIGGTLRYLAPEILRGEKPDMRTDIYSTGIIGYESLTGEEVFNEGKTSKILEDVLYKNLQPIKQKNKEIPDFINDVIMRMTDKLRLNRFTSFDNVIEVLQNRGKSKKEERYIEKILYSDFIGRKKYINKIYNLIDKVSKSEGQIIVIEGIPGTGKTRLLKEIYNRLFLNGKNAQYLRITKKTKFNFTWLIELLERADNNLSKLRIMLEKGELTLSDKGKYKFFEKIAAEMLNISQNKIQFFILDDVDFTDSIMTDFILYFSNFLEKNPFLFIMATENIPENLESAFENRIYRNLSHHKLLGLDKNESLLFVKNMLGVIGNVEKLNDFLYTHTNGNPYFIEELLKTIVEKTLLKKEGNDLTYKLSAIKKIPTPGSVGLFVTERIKKLSAEEKEILKLASVYGDPVPLSWLLDLSSFKESKTIKISESSSLKQFFSASEKNRLDFTHKVVRTIIYDSLQEKEKISLHKRILQFLERQKETSYILHLKAYHSFICKDSKAELFLIRILRKSVENSDVESAIDAFEKLKQLNAVDFLLKADRQMLPKIGTLYYLAGQFDKAISLYNELLQKLKKKSEKIQVLHNLAMTKPLVSQYDEAKELFEKLLKEKLPLGQRFQILIDLGWFYYSRKEYKKAEEIYKKTLLLPRKGLKKKVLIAKLYYNLSTLYQQTNKLEKAEFYGKKVIKIAKKYENQLYLIAGLNILATVEQTNRRFDKAIIYYKNGLKFLQKTENIPRKLHMLSNLAKLLFSVGNIEESKRNYFVALSEAKKLGNLRMISSLYNLYGRILSQNAEWGNALDFLEKSNLIAKNIEEPIIQLSNISEILFIFAFQGKNNEFETLMKKVQNLKKQMIGKKEFLEIELIMAIQKYIKSDFKNALSYLKNIEDSIGKLNVPEYQIPALIYESLCLIKIDKKENALESISRAKEIMKNSKMFLYKEEVKFADALIWAKNLLTSRLKNKFKRLLNKTRKNQRFLYSRVLVALSDMNYEEFAKKRRKDYLSESISLLKEAREILTEIDAQPLISEVSDKLFRALDKFHETEIPTPKTSKYVDLISEISNLIKHLDNPEDLKKSFIPTAKAITGAERGLFLSLDSDTDEFIVTGKDVDEATICDAKEFSKNVIKKVTRTRKPLIAYDAIKEKHFKNFESVKLNKIRSILCVPVIKNDEVLGVLYLDSRKTPQLFSKEEQELVSSISMLLADSLIRAFGNKRMEKQLIILKKTLKINFGPENLIGRSEKMQEAFSKIEKFAQTDIPVLILGESGTGKELVARSTHLLSKRKDNNFLIIDCSAIISSLIESELFGYKKGTFTGAGKDKVGQLESADKGTLFIDEIANASEALQARLLRFLDTGEIKKLGAAKYKKVETRIIVASNKDLFQLVKDNKFMEDLYYRISKFIIYLPPLRERKEDIKPLIDHYIDFYNGKYNKNIKGVTKRAFDLLYNYEWPGNVRTLKNEIERCVFFCNESLITKENLSEVIYEPTSFLTLSELKKKFIKEHIMRVLSYTNGSVTKAARMLHVDTKTIYRNIKK